MSNNRNDIVISGASGRFPRDCQDIDQFCESLFNGIDLVTENEDRWPKGTYGLPTRSGTLTSLQNFDADFFKISGKQADYMDPVTRINIETTFEALCDAGIDPFNMGNMRVGQFSSKMINEIDLSLGPEDDEALQYPQFTERWINYIFNIKNGDSCCDTACSSSLTALSEAFNSLKHGLIDVAIVNTANILWSPAFALNYARLGVNGAEGICRFLDAKASGYVRGESSVSIILQRECDAVRIHAYLVTASTNCDGYKPQGITYPKSDAQANLLRQCYKQANVEPNQINFFECHGTGTQVGDKEEVKAIWKVFGEKRSSNQPLLLGSVKTNIGHCESSSGLPSLVKGLIIFKKKFIPPNIYFEQPSPKISELINGLVAPVITITPFTGHYIPINNFGFGGANAHVLMRNHLIQNQNQNYLNPFSPSLLLLCCGRTKNSIELMTNKLSGLGDKVTAHFARIVNRYSNSIRARNMTYRCYIVTKPNEFLISPISQIELKARPICFIIPGIGCQWDNVVTQFTSIKPFRASLEECVQIIDPTGENQLSDLLMGKTSSSAKPYLKCLALVIFQIAAIDTLLSLEIVPDLFVGHSLGEVACMYLDGFLTKFETLKVTHALCKAIEIIQSGDKNPSASMISVGLSWNNLAKICPPTVYPSCFNAEDNITISGYTDEIVKLAQKLKNQNIFVREFNSFGAAFHCPLIKNIADIFWDLLKDFSNIFRQRSARWIQSHESSMKNCSKPIDMQKFMHEIIVNTVTFDQACQSIPDNAICIEIAPKKILASLLKRNLSNSASILVPFEIVSTNQPSGLLSHLGDLYNFGVNLKPETVLPEIKGPAPIETPFFSPLIKLDHNQPRLVRKFPELFNKSSSASEKFTFDLTKSSYSFLDNYCVSGVKLFPVSGLIYAVWSKFASLKAIDMINFSVRLERLNLQRYVPVNSDKIVFRINFLPSNQGKVKFVLSDLSNELIMTGLISQLDTDLQTNNFEDGRESTKYDLDMNSFYSQLFDLGVEYKGQFKTISSVSKDYSHGALNCDGNWILLFESVLQIMIASEKLSAIQVTAQIDEIICQPMKAIKIDQNFCYDKMTQILTADSLYVRGVYLDSLYAVDTLNIFSKNAETYEPKIDKTMKNVSEVLANLIKTLIELHQPVKTVTLKTMETNDELIKATQGNLESLSISSEALNVTVLTNETKHASCNQLNCYNHLCLEVLQKDIQNNNITFICLKIRMHLNNNQDVIFLKSKSVKSLQKFGLTLVTSQRTDYGFFLLIRCKYSHGMSIDEIMFPANEGLFDAAENRHSRAWMPSKKLSHNQVFQDSLRCIVDLSSGNCENLKSSADLYNNNLIDQNEKQFDSLKSFFLANSYTKVLVTAPYRLNLSGSSIYGFSGRHTDGSKEFGIIKIEPFSHSVEIALNWLINDLSLSLPEIATLPLAYTLAYYILIIKGQLKSQESLLIHSGTDDVTLAALTIAHSLKCQVFTTVATTNEKDYVKSLVNFPNDNHVIVNENSNYEHILSKITNQQGIDLVISSPIDNKQNLEASLRCLKTGGRFILRSKYSMNMDNDLELGIFLQNLTFSGATLEGLFTGHNSDKLLKQIKILIQNGIVNGVVRSNLLHRCQLIPQVK